MSSPLHGSTESLCKQIDSFQPAGSLSLPGTRRNAEGQAKTLANAGKGLIELMEMQKLSNVEQLSELRQVKQHIKGKGSNELADLTSIVNKQIRNQESSIVEQLSELKEGMQSVADKLQKNSISKNDAQVEWAAKKGELFEIKAAMDDLDPLSRGKIEGEINQAIEIANQIEAKYFQ